MASITIRQSSDSTWYLEGLDPVKEISIGHGVMKVGQTSVIQFDGSNWQVLPYTVEIHKVPSHVIRRLQIANFAPECNLTQDEARYLIDQWIVQYG